MLFRTEISLKKADQQIAYPDNIVLLGSCFAENIGNRLKESKFNVSVNPFGILYNPLSIENALRILLEKRLLSTEDLFPYNGLWHSFAHHGVFSGIDCEETLQNINNQIRISVEKLLKTDFLLITFGTAFVYEKDGKTVANCHKLPDRFFTRRRLSVQEIVDCYTKLVTDIQQINPKIRFVFTVSPIRHWKDGAHENQLSKSTLLLAINELQTRCSNIDYFPAYEIVLDELRDYRFYEEDMLHPNNQAITYIWEKFSETYFSAETRQIEKEIAQIIKAENHRPLNPQTAEYQLFLQHLDTKKTDFLAKHPFVCFL
ncbi:MAG: GSCFA domain-containing protein [Prevotellaceae bacterium]|jgi:hypothetical protein|nr:GSCFA domain-containing protein [Prevotellaceae bacterium]